MNCTALFLFQNFYWKIFHQIDFLMKKFHSFYNGQRMKDDAFSNKKSKSKFFYVYEIQKCILLGFDQLKEF